MVLLITHFLVFAYLEAFKKSFCLFEESHFACLFDEARYMGGKYIYDANGTTRYPWM